MDSSQLKLEPKELEPKEEKDLKKCLKNHDEKKNHLHLVELAGTVGDIAAQEEKSDALLNFLMDWLTDLKQEEPNQPKNSFCFDFFVECWKVVLALGILVASQEKPGKQKDLLDDSLLKIVKASDSPDPDFPCPVLCSRLALSELTYVDQYLHSFTDRENTDTENKIDVRHYCMENILERCQKDPWASPIRDYVMNIEAWDIRTKYSYWLRESEEKGNQKSPEVYAICSVKGGVGKTITAIGLFNHLVQNKNKKVLLIDLDVAGPTLQFHLNIPDCVKPLSAVPPPEEKKIYFDKESLYWCYPAFSSVYQARKDYEDGEVGLDTVKEETKKAFLSIEPSKDGKVVVCLPDSPTLSGRLDTDLRFDMTRELIALQRTLKFILKRAKKEEFDYVIVDSSPGIVGRNGPLLRWFCDNYPTRLLLVSSTRAPDLATALYDGTWAAAKGEFQWSKPVVHLINVWPKGKNLEKVLKKWTEDFTSRTIRTNLKSAWESNTSAAQIYFWRMWCYLYVYGVKKRSEEIIKIRSLPHDENLRELLSVPIESEAEFKIDVDKLLESPWMTKLLEVIFPDEPQGSIKPSK